MMNKGKAKCMSKGGKAKMDNPAEEALEKATGKKPVKLAMGGTGKTRKNYPMTKGKK